MGRRLEWLAHVAFAGLTACTSGTSEPSFADSGAGEADGATRVDATLGADGTAGPDAAMPESGDDSASANDSAAGLGPDPAPALPGFLWEMTPQTIVNTGGLVGAWGDIGPYGFTLAGSGAQRGTYVADALNGYPGVQGSASAPTLLQTSGAYPFKSQVATVYMVASLANQTATDDELWGTQPSAAADGGFGVELNQQMRAVLANAQGQNGYTLCEGGLSSSPYQVLTWQFDQSGGIFQSAGWVGRNRLGWNPTLQTSYSFYSSALNLFARSDRTFAESGTVVHWAGFNAAHTQAQIDAMVDWLSGRYGLNGTKPTRALYIDGDSISGDTGGITTSWPAHVVLDGAFPSIVVNSVAWYGKNTAEGYEARATEIANVRSGIPANAILFLGTNDFATGPGGDPATDFATYLAPYVSFLKASGVENVGVMTMLPRGGLFLGGQTESNFEAQREGPGGWNPTIRANASTYGYDVLDVGGDAVLGDPSSLAGGTYYQADETHPTDAGEAIIYGYAAKALETWGY